MSILHTDNPGTDQPTWHRQADGIGAGCAQAEKLRGWLLNVCRYGTWSGSLRFPVPVERGQPQTNDHDGLLCLTAPKAHKLRTETVEG